MSGENRLYSLKRSYPEEEDKPSEKETEGVLTNVISILKSQEKEESNSKNQQPLPAIRGFVPPPNTPCTSD